MKATVAIISTLACIVALLAWAISYLPANAHVVLCRGKVLIAGVDAPDSMLEATVGGTSGIIRSMSESGNDYGHFLGFARIRGSFGMLGGFDIIAIPFWAIVLVTGIVPALWWASVYRRRKWRATGRCAGCGYDLRGSPERCPECGASVARPAAQPLGSGTEAKSPV
jgi:hypothetical protein